MQYVLYVTIATKRLSSLKTRLHRPPSMAKPEPQPRTSRRSQADRRRLMRKRLVEATLATLVEAGYSGTTVSAIVRRAGVSRGAQLHHFPSKQQLMLETAEHLLKRAYKVMGEVLLAVATEDDRAQAVVESAWKELYGSQAFGAYFELAQAAQHDADLAQALKALSQRFGRTISLASAHYFESRAGAVSSAESLFSMTHWVLGAIGATRHLQKDAEQTREMVRTWASLLSGQIKARRGVRLPPPRPPDWDG